MALADVRDPQIREPHDVLVRMGAVGVCGSDIHYYTTGRIGRLVVEYPFTVGHECAGTVVEVGPAVKLHGVVNSVNASAGRVNITHDPVPELKWPAMKMNFKAHDAAMLKDLKPGMTVDFEIQKMGNE